ncbi:MAG: hypothetical protein Q4D73_06085 [Actinomycetaceae bacterium]|nr:hypothetical protein [Actinomycetaceae bacterium]
MNIWFFPLECQLQDLERTARQALNVAPYRIDVKIDPQIRRDYGLEHLNRAYTIAKGGCECEGMIGGNGKPLYRGATTFEQIQHWLSELGPLLSPPRTLALMRAWTPQSQVAPNSVRSIQHSRLREEDLANLGEDQMLIIRLGA